MSGSETVEESHLGNQQNGNGVAPQVDGNLLYALLSEQQRTNDRYDDHFQAMQRTNNALETGISELDTRHNTLETNQAASRNHISDLQARHDALEARLQAVEKMVRDRGQNQAAVDATKSKQRDAAAAFALEAAEDDDDTASE